MNLYRYNLAALASYIATFNWHIRKPDSGTVKYNDIDIYN